MKGGFRHTSSESAYLIDLEVDDMNKLDDEEQDERR